MRKKQRSSDDGQLGAHIRGLRLSRHMSLGDLAAVVDTSRSFLSQVEQGQALPSLGTLKAIASALAVTVGSLIDEPPAGSAGPVVTEEMRGRLESLQTGVVIEALTGREIHKVMQPILLRLESGATSGREGYAHGGQEFGFVLQGHLQVEVDQTLYRLKEGDTIYFDSSRPHRLSNPGDGEAVAIWVVAPATF